MSTPIAELMASAADARDTANRIKLLTPGSMLDLGVQRLLFRLIGANMNSVADQAFTKLGLFNSYMLRVFCVTNASIPLSAAVGGIYGATGKSGDQLMTAAQTYSALIAANAGIRVSHTNAAGGARTETPILSLATPQGAVSTADFYIFGWPLS